MMVQILTIISTVDDLNYPEKTDTYYIVNAPYVFTACWKVGDGGCSIHGILQSGQLLEVECCYSPFTE